MRSYTQTSIRGIVWLNKVTSTKKLMDKKQLSNLVVRCLILKHIEENCKMVASGKYQDEIDYLVSSKSRNNFIKI